MNRTTILGFIGSAAVLACCVEVARPFEVPERKNPPKRVTPRQIRAAFDWAWTPVEMHDASNYLASVNRSWTNEFTVELLNTNGPVRDCWQPIAHWGAREWLVMSKDGRRVIPVWDVLPWGRFGSVWEEE